MKIFLTLLAFTLIVFAGCGYDDYVNNVNATVEPIVTFETGHGETTFRLEVTDDENNLIVWNVSTDETTVGAALLSLGLIEGEESSMGLMVTTVNGVTADYNADRSWWAFYIDGEFATSGVDSTYIEEGTAYALVFTR
ncbi:MAG: DUF4430 domain-containing protein [Defluviitaleaceae bacterium]|nr:DUF4430 domain-containing protein [Defluviitaleaceae bacterium]